MILAPRKTRMTMSTSKEAEFAQSIAVGYHVVCALFPNPAGQC